MKSSNAATILALTLAFVQTADGDAARGLEIATKVDEAGAGWVDERVNAMMTLRAANGREIKRAFRTRSLEIAGDGDKTLLIFDTPKDVKGTVFLTHAQKRGNDDQWLYLPAIKRVKRISSSNRSGPFMGSEFAYEDVSSEELERYTYNYVADATCGEGADCHVYERFPVDENSGYTRQVVFADKDFYRVHRIEYYDRKGAHLKTLTRTGFRRIGEFWRASHWEMANHLKGKTTVVEWQDRAFGVGLRARDFDRSAMSKFR